MKKCKRIETENGDVSLPEATIQHIQSLLSREEAARTTILSKSWYNAWSTRPQLHLVDRSFFDHTPESFDMFKEYAKKTMRRYQHSSLNIDSFRLRCSHSNQPWADKLIVDAIKIGATDVDIELPRYTLGQEVLGSKTLVKLSLSQSDGICVNVVRCSNLKSLSFNYVSLKRKEKKFNHLISCCESLEELSLSNCFGFELTRTNLYQLHKLTRLYLYEVYVDQMFFSDFETRFPCLKALSVRRCRCCKRIDIASTTVETISFEITESWRATFDVPNIRKFTYLGSVLPRLSINGSSSCEWEFDVTIACNQFNNLSWFLSLKNYLLKFKPSRMSLTINLEYGWRRPFEFKHEVDIKAVAEPVLVENLTINATPSFCCALLVRLFGICRPKFITLYWLTDKCDRWSLQNESLDILCKRLMQQVITPDCCIPDQTMFGQFGLRRVNVEVYEMIYTKWRPLPLIEPLDVSKTLVSKRKICFQLIWD